MVEVQKLTVVYTDIYTVLSPPRPPMHVHICLSWFIQTAESSPGKSPSVPTVPCEDANINNSTEWIRATEVFWHSGALQIGLL